jgi:hypothetical protein
MCAGFPGSTSTRWMSKMHWKQKFYFSRSRMQIANFRGSRNSINFSLPILFQHWCTFRLSCKYDFHILCDSMHPRELWKQKKRDVEDFNHHHFVGFRKKVFSSMWKSNWHKICILFHAHPFRCSSNVVDYCNIFSMIHFSFGNIERLFFEFE